MINNGVRARGTGKARAGSLALTLLATPLSAAVVRALAEQPTSLVDLRAAVGSPADTTLRARMRSLAAVGGLERTRQAQFPGPVDCRLAPAGIGLLRVADVLECWLAAAPRGPISLGDRDAKKAVKALVAGWSSTVVRALAARPLTLTELNRLIGSLNYPSLERRLTAMRRAGLIEVASEDSGGTPYELSPWLRAAAGSLVFAAAWEQMYAPGETEPISRLDLEATFLLAAPLISLPAEVSGTARLAVRVDSREDPRPVGVVVAVRAGHVVSCVARLEGDPDAWAIGPISAWLQLATEGEHDGLELGGDRRLVAAILDSLRQNLLEPAGVAGVA